MRALAVLATISFATPVLAYQQPASPVIQVQTQGPAAATEPSRAELLQRLMTFVSDEYLGTGRDDYENRPELYADDVDYYGRARTSRAGVMAGKRAYYAKWPSRRYVLIPGSLQARPGPDDSVEITFRFTYHVARGTRFAEGIGTTTLGLILADGRYQIVKETGGIVRRTSGR